MVPAPFADALPWGSRDATGVVDVPERLVVIGGGVVACEAATWMAALGSRVTMLVRGERVLAGQEPFVGDEIAEALWQEVADVEDTGIGRVHGGPVTVETDDGTVEADEVLAATGRRPRLGGLGLHAVGL